MRDTRTDRTSDPAPERRQPGGAQPVAKVTMPQLGESVAEGTIGRWLKKPGDHVAKYEPLLEVITDKVNAEVPSPFEGTLTQILAEEGATVPNNAEIAIIETVADGAGNGSAPPAPPRATETVAASDPAIATESVAAPLGVSPNPTPMAPTAEGTAEATGHEDARMTPAVRRLLREHGLSPAQIAGTGHGGRITRDDVMAFVEARRTGAAPASPTPAAPAPPAPDPVATAPAATAPAATASAPVEAIHGADEQLIPWNQMRKGVATAMVRSKTTVPHAYTTVEVDVSGLARLRDVHKSEYQAREGISLSYVPFFIKGVVETLKRHPKLNAHWTEDGLLVKRRINVAVAIAVDDGLLTPVIHDADNLSINGLNRSLQDLATRARANRLRLEDLQGGTITVNNTGWFGSVTSQSIVNTPQVVIVNMEAIVKRPVVLSGPDGDTIGIRSMMNLPAAFDHRATDGAQVGRFVADLRSWLEAIPIDTPIY
jgi:2-oxoisovalerate dehydrogenase E2 component (dihydrolipoyl transacylase)